jgi:hypothetical protein
MVTYPLTFPAVPVKTSSFRLVNVVSENQSIFTGASQVYAHQGQWWAGELKFVPMKRELAREAIAFLLSLRGKFGTFHYGDPDFLALGPQGAGGGTPLVNGASQTGNTLAVDGLPVSTTVYRKYDYFSLGSGETMRLYCLTADAVTNASGEVTLEFEPRLRESPSDNDAVTFTGAKGTFQLSENVAEWDVNESNIYDISIPFKEALRI